MTLVTLTNKRTVQTTVSVAILVILAAATLVIHVIEAGNMKKSILIWSGLLTALCLVIFLFSSQQFREAAFAALSAIATCLLVIVAYKALKGDENSFLVSTRLKVFSDSISLMHKDYKFQDSADYILNSSKFQEEIRLIKQCMEIDKKDDIGLQDFIKASKRIQKTNDNKNGKKDDPEKGEETDSDRLLKSLRKIKYFCSRMEYLGVLAEEKEVCSLILKYYRRTIISSYKKLEPIINKTREHEKDSQMYINFEKLYNLAIESKKHD